MKLHFTRQKLERGLKIAIVLLLLMTAYLSSNAQILAADKVNIGLVYPISTNGSHAAADTNFFSFNLLAGVSAAERGFSFAGFSNVIKYKAEGMQFAGFSNHVGKRSEGMMFAGFANIYREAKGIQFAGFTNIAVKNVKGAQFAGFLNRASDLDGTQLAGFVNLSRNIMGTQMAGFGNVAKNVRGSQFAGFINSAENVKGSQFAGFINRAKNVKGIQGAGFINIADSSDHPLGFINIIRNGEKSIGLSLDESQTLMASFRSGGTVLYGIIAAGYNFKNEEEVYAFEIGLGAHMMSSKTFRINAEASTLSLESFWSGEYFKSSFKLMPSFRPVKHLEIFGGPTFNYVSTNTSEGMELTDKYIKTWENRQEKDFKAIYVGYSGGINIIF